MSDMRDPPGPDPGYRRRMRRLRDAWKRQDEESASTFAVLMAGIATLFIAGIVTAFIFARDNAEQQAMQQNAERAAASAAAPNASGGSADRPAAPAAQPETTGSGSAGSATPPKVHPREDEQNEEPPRR